MKKWMKKITVATISSILLCALTPLNVAQAGTTNANITIDGYYDDWSGLPYSWEYNWDNPYIIEKYWDGTQNITKYYRDENGNPYNLEIRHKMSLYCDGEYIYLHIEMATNNNDSFNGESYQFFVDGEKAQFRLTYVGGDNIHKNDKKEPGIYPVELRHGDTAISGNIAEGAVGYYTKKQDDINNEMELRVPLTALKAQNDNINLESYNTIEFFTPNLMYRKISCSGTSTGPYAGIALCSLVVGGAVLMRRRKIKGSKV